MKHIKFKAEIVAPDFQQVNVTILEQTHRGTEFGSASSRYMHEGYELASITCPARNINGKGMFMRGDRVYSDNNEVILSVAEYAKFKAAVEAYNKEFADKATATDVCTVIVG